ncbi:MAG TPA: hypothetical protein VK470_04065 [Bacteroidota bacterium]|nr:hypothetical protein [Bacteroidota bacterium]
MTLFAACFIIIPALTFPLVVLAYFLQLNRKRREVDRLMTGNTMSRYVKAYGKLEEGEMFSWYCDWREYILPVTLNTIVVSGTIYFILVQWGIITMDAIPPVIQASGGIPLSVIWGLTGAYIWGQYDMNMRFWAIDLSPNALYSIWLRFLVSGALSYILSNIIQPPFVLLVAFGLGAFPVNTLSAFLRAQVRQQLKYSGEALQTEQPNLHMLQGMSPEIAERLKEEYIYSAQQLALANPIRLLMNTGFEWTVILDLIDQAILYNYIGPKIVDVHKAGIRSAMEMSGIKDYFDDEAPGDLQMGIDLIREVAKRLEWEEVSVKNLIETLYTDPQLVFIWQLWEDAFATTQEPESPAIDRNAA